MLELKTLGDRVRAIRNSKRWTLDELAGYAGLSKGFLSDLENTKREPSTKTLIGLSDALGVSVEWLVRGHNVKPEKCPMCAGRGKIFAG